MPQGIVNKLSKQKLSGKQFGFQMVFPVKSYSLKVMPNG